MSDPRRCPNCGQPLLGITSTEEIASCPSCGRFYERLPEVGSRGWPAPWKIALILCGPMLLAVSLRAGQWLVERNGGRNTTIYSLFSESLPFLNPLAWFVWPIVAAFLLANKYAPAPDRWMTSIGLTVAGLVGSTLIMLASLLVQILI